ncbi:hypothetical protein PIB30_079876 [Stylosanthes scabra]|uniref:Uncharacterized protein n=1 Tax=Stylosanthes scabra TaxID=79078 RepID=A0ABU6QRY4_9FABA|nr:hypothetical protein [Stylosanthes scabra]
MVQSSVHKCIAGKQSNSRHAYHHYQLCTHCHLKDRKCNKETKQGPHGLPHGPDLRSHAAIRGQVNLVFKSRAAAWSCVRPHALVQGQPEARPLICASAPGVRAVARPKQRASRTGFSARAFAQGVVRSHDTNRDPQIPSYGVVQPRNHGGRPHGVP